MSGMLTLAKGSAKFLFDVHIHIYNMKKMNMTELLKVRRNEIMRIAAKYGARNIRLFGSVARGDASQDSDVDFLVDLEPGRSLFDLGGLLMDLQDLLACNVDVVTERGLRPRIRDRVLKEAKPL